MPIDAHMTDTLNVAPELLAPRHSRHGHICSAGQPFAQLSIGPRDYEVAEVANGPDMLAFRIKNHQEWSALDRRKEDGWIKIGADILLLDPDVLFDFLQTHAVRQSAASDESSTEMVFDTLGLSWRARLLQDRDGEVCIENGEWQYARLGLQAPPDGRARAIMILLSAIPDARRMFEPHVTNWATRIAQGVEIKPIF